MRPIPWSSSRVCVWCFVAASTLLSTRTYEPEATPEYLPLVIIVKSLVHRGIGSHRRKPVPPLPVSGLQAKSQGVGGSSSCSATKAAEDLSRSFHSKISKGAPCQASTSPRAWLSSVFIQRAAAATMKDSICSSLAFAWYFELNSQRHTLR